MNRFAIALTAVLMLAACTADGSDEETVTVQGFRFQPPELTVPTGTTVTWENEDGADHTATATDTFDVDLPVDGDGAHTFDEPGTYAYFCSIHPSMTGQIQVE